MDKLEQAEARRIYEDVGIAMDNLAAIVHECTGAEYVSKRYIREKIKNVEYIVNFIKGMVEDAE